MLGMQTKGDCLRFHETGKPAEVLGFETMALEAPGEGELLVRMLAAPLNPADINTVQGNYGVKLALPAIPGIEGCGEVIESRADGIEAGQRVVFLRRAATWASHTVVRADDVFVLPGGIDVLQAAMLKVNPATAWCLLHAFVKPEPGEWIVQNAGNSAVGRCVIQLARELGVRTISFVRREELIAELKELGGDLVLLDDEDGRAKALEAMGGANARLAFNAVGGESALRVMKLLCEGGTHVTFGAMAKKPLTIPNGLIIFRGIHVRGLWVTKWIEHAAAAEVQQVYRSLAELVLAGKLVQKVDTTFPLENFQEALARLDAAGRDGKVLFEMGR